MVTLQQCNFTAQLRHRNAPQHRSTDEAETHNDRPTFWRQQVCASMIDAFFHGIVVLAAHASELLLLLLSGLGFGAISALLLFRHKDYDDRIVYVLPLGFGFVGLAAPALSLFGALKAPVVGVFLLLGIAALALLVKRGAFLDWRTNDYRRNVWIPAGIFAIFLVLRLGFIEGLILPPFSDSVAHYEKLGSLLSLSHVKPFSFGTLFPYYHRGFHGIAAWVDAITGNTSPLTMSVTAQFFLGWLPAAVYYMLLAFTDRDISASVFGASLAGLGWIMPAYAADFGKYPALVAICLLPLVLGVFHLTNQSNASTRWEWWLYIAIASGALIWIHSRLAGFLACLYLIYYAGRLIQGRLPNDKFVTVALVFTSLTFFWMMVLDHDGTNTPSFRFYLDASSMTTILAISLVPFALRKYTTWVFYWSLAIVLLIVATSVALPSWLYHYPLTLMDQLFFDLLLFLPLTVLAALGMSALGKLLPAKGHFYTDVRLFLVLVVVVNGAFIQAWAPLGSANYVSQDDMRAFSWIANDTQPNSELVIAALPKTGNYSRASDSGAWISVLTGRPTVKVPFGFQWGSPESLRDLCTTITGHAAAFVYVAHMESSFNILSCNASTGLTPVLCYPKTKVFALDCSDPYG